MALRLLFSETVIIYINIIYLGGRTRMPRGAAEIGLPLRQEKGELQII